MHCGRVQLLRNIGVMFDPWKKGALESHLVKITGKVL